MFCKKNFERLFCTSAILSLSVSLNKGHVRTTHVDRKGERQGKNLDNRDKKRVAKRGSNKNRRN